MSRRVGKGAARAVPTPMRWRHPRGHALASAKPERLRSGAAGSLCPPYEDREETERWRKQFGAEMKRLEAKKAA